jgi:cytochrome c-type biogenesis protein
MERASGSVRHAVLASSGATRDVSDNSLEAAVWSPCVGPTLGAASLLAAQGRDLPQVGLTMLVFGIGAALPLLAIGLLSREAVLLLRTRLLSSSYRMKAVI